MSGYALVPAGAPLTIIGVNGASVASPVTALAAGSDSTLMVYGNRRLRRRRASSATTTTCRRRAANLKLRLLNGLTGTASPVNLDAAFAVIASNVLPGTASTYAVVGSTTPLQLDVFATSTSTPIYSTTGPTGSGAPLSLPGNSVYTLFMLGDASAPIARLIKDR